ncbi:MAG: PepSY domain-containing protein [Clostridia bacterium]|nr:PepSY domain-containing protein [Clostridia bacterium]
MKRVWISLLAVLTLVVLFSGCELNIHLPAKVDGTTTAAPQTTQPVSVPIETEAPSAVTEATTKNEIYTKPIENPSTSADVSVSKEEAKSIVLAHAGLTASDVKRYKAELDRERGGLVYEIEFDSGKYEYEYEVDAQNGRILKAEKDFRD